ncbi:DUF1453 family protein [Deinococcus maricopensis]|uniref:DUF1453 domain-containing protein n=1 Tax=Deinococcus maricopensis (strain DSM 21211 / LMG 22137 / NRRL B-23946 / LB-34) TaxID=709986 RepID=E8UBM1_DEIML|nr:DUF1453 family protein [Deinococcus maricopensis]ADV68460.1 hypothetical protein Deima_2831 [Deinococcus maricopensis DSM 21211]
MNELHAQLTPQVLVFTVLIGLLIASRTLGERQRRVDRWWLLPAVLLLLTVNALWADLSASAVSVLLALLGVAGGAVVGELTARTQTVRLDPERLNVAWVRGSPLTLAVLVVSLAVRVALRTYVLNHPAGLLTHATTALLAFSLTVLFMRGYSMYRRVQQLRAA